MFGAGDHENEEELNDEDIQKVVEEMGYQVPEGFNLTLKDLDRILGNETVNDFNTTLFSGLQCDDLPRPSMFCNPPSAARFDPSYISLADMTSISDKEERYLKRLLQQGYECLQRMTEEMEYIDEKLKPSKTEEQNVVADAEPIVMPQEAAPFREVNGNLNDLRGRRPQMNPALRPVPASMRAPGRAAFKHDPVGRYQQYAKEWLENPPPGEKKRLALRWKVREYMMRMDAPLFKPLSEKPPEKKPWCISQVMSRFLVRQAGRFQNALASHDFPGLHWLLEGFNYYDKERVKEVGPDRTAAEWIVRCDGKVRFDRIDEVFEDYNALIRRTAELDPRKVEDQVKLVSIDATGSSITAYGCRHFKNLEKIVDVQLINCKSLHDFGLEYIGDEVGDRLQFLQIENCPRITEFGLKHLTKFTGLKSLILKDLHRVHDPEKAIEEIKKALPNCDVHAKL